MQRQERPDKEYDIRQTTYEGVDINIIRNKAGKMYSVYAKTYANIEWIDRWYIEISSNYATNLAQAKSVAEKLCDIALWYNSPKPWREY